MRCLKTFLPGIILLLCCAIPGIAQTKQDLRLLEAVKRNNITEVEKLIKAGANVNTVDSNMATTLMWAAYNSNLSLFKILVKKEADYKKKGVIYLDSTRNGYYGNILAIAAAKNDTLLLTYCLDSLKIPVNDHEYDPKAKQASGWAPIHWAATNGSLAAIKILVQHKADINEIYAIDGNTPLLYAVQGGKTSVILYLVALSGIDINIKNKDGGALLHYVSRDYDASNFIKELVEKGAIVNIQTNSGNTPLMLAAYNDRNEVCLTLLELNADAALTDLNNKTAFEKAFSNKKYGTALCIEKYINGYSLRQIKALIDSIAMNNRLYVAGDSCNKIQQYNCAVEKWTLKLNYSRLIYGKKHPDYATSLNNLANLYNSMGSYEKALPLYQESLQIDKEVLGEKHPDYAISLHNLAGLYESMGSYEKALPLYQESLQIKKEVLGEKHPVYANSLNDLAWLYNSMGSYKKALPLYQESLQIRKEALGEKHPDYAASLNNLALLYENLGSYEKALPLYQESLQINKEALGEKHPYYATSLNNLAGLYKSMGSYGKALPLYQKSLQIDKEVLGEKHPYYALSLNNLAGLYQSQGSYEKALPLYQESLQIRKEALGERHPDYGASLNNLAGLYQSQGSYEKALPLYQESLQIRKEALGEKHPDYAASLDNLADLYKSMGSYEKALPLCQESLQIRKEALGEKHPDYAASLDNLAVLYKSMGSYEKALPLYQKSLQVKKEALGEKHPNYALSLNNLALLYQSMGSYEKALPLCQESSHIYKVVLGEKHSAYAASLNNLALLYHTMSRYEKALPLYQESLHIYKEALGEKHPNYATFLDNLAGLYHSMGSYEKALPLYQESLQIRKEALGEKHPDYALSLNNLASLYQSMGSYEKALPLYQESLKIRKETLGENHPAYAGSLNNLALLYKSMGSYEKALPLYQQSLQIRKEALGEKHPAYAGSLNNLALLYQSMGRYEKALPLYQESLQIRKGALGEKHPDYAGSLNNLAGLYSSMGSYEKALSIYKESLQIYKVVLGEKHPNYANSLNNLALLYENMGSYDKTNELMKLVVSLQTEYIRNSSKFLSQSDIMRFIDKGYYLFDIMNSFAFTHRNNSLGELGFQSELLLKGASLQNNRDLSTALQQNDQPGLTGLINQLTATKNQLKILYQKNAAAQQTDSLSAVFDKYEQQLMQISSEYQKMVSNRNIQWKQVQQKLKPDEAAIEFLQFAYWNKKLTDTIFYAAYLLLPKGEPQMVVLCTKKMLEQRINDTLEKKENYVEQLYGVTDRGVKISRNGKDTVSSLYQLLWKPLDSLLTGMNTIYYAPAGLLHRVNPAAINYDRKNVLGDKYAFHLMGSTRDIVSYKSEYINNKTDTLLVYGGIDFDMDSSYLVQERKKFYSAPAFEYGITMREGTGFYWPPLEGSADELAFLRDLSRDQKIPAHSFTQKDASEESFNFYTQQTHSPALIHIASHGFFYPDDQRRNLKQDGIEAPYFMSSYNAMFRSGIVFAGANYVTSGKQPVQGIEDGIVTAYDISNANLHDTKLTVLSACETGLGKIENSEGVFGLQRAIRMAGCKNLVMSLWKVPDIQTTRFMNYFYTQLLQEKKSIYDSFQYAQKQMRELYSGQPYFWAAFVLME